MLNVIIAGTNNTATLSIIDPKTDVDWINDFIGNYDGFGVDVDDIDSKFVKIEDLTEDDLKQYPEYLDFSDALDNSVTQYVTSKDNYDWWADVIKSQQELDDLTQKAKDAGISDDDINDALDQPQSDLDDLIYAQIQEISELIEQVK